MYSDRPTSPSIRRRSATVAATAVPTEVGEMQYGMAMGSKMTPKGDKFGWLGKTGIVKDVSKSQEAKAGGHAAPTSIQPDGHPNPAMVQKANWPAPMNNERSPGKDTMASRTRGTTAKSANIEGNESPKYEALEKKSLKSLKHGGSEKELREGHNEVTSAPIAGNTKGGAAPTKAAGPVPGSAGHQYSDTTMTKEKGGMKTPKKAGGKVSKVMSEWGQGKLRSGSKKGPVVKSQKQAVAIGLSEARKAGEKVPAKKK